MMIGVPGSGKSTAIKELMSSIPGLKTVSSDEYIETVAKEKGKTYDEVHMSSVDDAIKWMKSQIQSFIKSKQDFVWDQTNVVKSARIKKLRTLSSQGYNVTAITFELPIEELHKRLDKRTSEGGKSISHKIINNMIDSYERPSYDEGFTTILIIDESGNPTELPQDNKQIKP
jgi:predicted kinase